MKAKLPYFLLISCMIFWAANFYLVKIAMAYYSPMAVAAYRFFFALLALLVVCYLKFGKALLGFRFTKRDWVALLSTAFFGIFACIYYFNLGLKTTSAINGSLIVATGPAVTAILATIWLGRKLNPLQWLAILISFVGVTVILVKGELERLLGLNFEMGDFYMVLMVLSFAISQIIVAKYLPQVDAIILSTISAAIGLVLFIGFSLSELTTVAMPTAYDFWASILFMGVLGTAVGYTAFFYGIIKLGETTTSLFLNLIPFIVLLLAIPFGEGITTAQLIGGAIVITGLLLFNQKNSSGLSNRIK